MKVRTHLCVLIALLLSVSCQEVATEQNESASNPEVEYKQNRIEPVAIEDARQKAVHIAEKFVEENGYTDKPADRNNVSHETVEFYGNTNDLLKERYNTLESKAYGILAQGRGGKNAKGWTVVFRYNRSHLKDLPEKDYVTRGRAVTMDEDFEHLLVEHKDFNLQYAERLQ